MTNCLEPNSTCLTQLCGPDESFTYSEKRGNLGLFLCNENYKTYSLYSLLDLHID